MSPGIFKAGAVKGGYCGGKHSIQIVKYRLEVSVLESEYRDEEGMEYSNWRARQLGQTRKIALTNKGIREFYRAYYKPKKA